MKIDKETLRKIAHLARLDFEENAEKDMISSMSEILTWVEKLNEVDTENVEPLTHMSMEVNNLREDILLPPLDHEKGLKNAPKKDSDYFRVPKVLE
ncbi:MAG: Asp-tRNA(Asn)/Glu-tRNA(Gln) amidotransferase subunit GatC [Bacteroidota bacterium]|jgi:aspartyl-tRNA(Asn)/glutamyl-tRNA(Gln) amidotransferase subunit C|nr:Asp-tRNA(Asn)/Glu-tRNA(Gln) amidotransferase subunit GatC [Bacteroidota bacterium]